MSTAMSSELMDAGREWGAPLTEADARALTAQIRESVQTLLPMLRTAWRRRADLALGYESWEAYCNGELAGLRLPLGDRQHAVGELRKDGMSQRAIGSALGISAATVNRTLSTVSDETVPDRVQSLDGKDRPASRPSPEPPADLRAAVLAKLPKTKEKAATVIALARAVGGKTDQVRQLLTEMLAAGEVRCGIGDHAHRYWLAPPRDLRAEVVGKLRASGPAGVLAAQVAFLLDPGKTGEPTPDVVVAMVHELHSDGVVCRVGETDGGELWALNELLPDETPEPSECLGTDMDCGRPLPCPDHPRTPEERIAAVAEVAPEFVRPVETPAPVADAPAPSRDPDPAPRSPEGQKLADDLARDSERRAAAAGIRSVLTYTTSRVLTPKALAEQYVIVLDEFTAADLRFAAETLAALATLKEQR